jgi:diguanylate cyclase (GGDEF)-like protein
MQTPDPRTLSAFFRFVTARLEYPAVGVYEVLDGAARLCGGTDAFHAYCGGEPGSWDALPPVLAEALNADGPVRVDPATIGIASAYAALMPVRSGGNTPAFLLFLDGRRRWLGPKPAAGMRDAAALLAALSNTPAPAGAAQAAEPTPDGLVAGVTSRILPLADARRMIRAECASAGRTAVLLLDMDRFRAINAALGAAAGDSLLALTATRLERSIGESEKLARLGADRFLILSSRPEAELPVLAARLLASVAEPLSLAGHSVTMQATIGLSPPQPAGTPAATQFLQADTALRRGKAEGGNRVVLHEPGHNAALSDASRLELDLAKAIDEGQLSLVYQPYVSLDTDRIVGVEALLRWQHPDRGELHPAQFIALAEATGQILPIGTWALRTALRKAVDWPEGIRLSVNISAMQFHQPDFTARVDSALAASGFPAERLELEITETVLMRDNPETIGQIRTLIARGIKIALDDFGTGYTALAYLTRLPHHRLKLDQGFVRDLSNPATADLVRAIVTSARSQGIAVTAEGVESPEQLEQVRRLGFTHAQGFVTGAPLADPSTFFRSRQAALA